MIQVFDTHRLPYINAMIRAFSKEDPTVALQFKDSDGTDIGNIVYTNALGYVCYGSNMHQVEGLKLPQSAIIQVSLDGGLHWNRIQWVIDDDNHGYLNANQIGTLTFFDDEGNEQTWNPTQGDAQLPDYIRRDEIDLNNLWQESTIAFEPDDTEIEADQWTSVIIIDGVNDASALQVNCANCRTGQKIVILSTQDAHLHFSFGNGSVQNVDIPAYYMAIAAVGIKANNRRYGNCMVVRPWTEAQIKAIADTEIDALKLRTQESTTLTVTENDQVFNVSTPVDSGMYYIRIEDTDDPSHTNVEVRVPSPAYPGVYPVMIEVKYDHLNASSIIKLTVGSNTAETVATISDNNVHQILGRIVRWNTTGTITTKYALFIDGEV